MAQAGEVTIERDGVTHQGRWTLSPPGYLKVEWSGAGRHVMKFAPLDQAAPEPLARWLLGQIVDRVRAEPTET